MIEYAKKSKASAYLMKPYRDKEILATISVTLWKEQNYYSKKNANIVKIKNNYTFNLQTLTLSKAKKHIPLTPVKNKLIEILAKNIDIVVPHTQICNFIWGEPRELATLRSLVYRTKQAIGEDLIRNVNGVGYSLKSKI
jgi:DNA-binding response OmpR family regulator